MNEPEDEYDSDEGSSGSEGDDEEPKLKYQRLGDSVKVILERDSATCMTVNERFLTLGTHSGRVYVLDFNGNEIKNFPSHSSTVNAISIDATGEFLASCSNDGKVVINGLYTNETVENNFRSPLLSVALDPSYAKAKQKSYVCGGTTGTLVRSQKGFWRTNSTTIHSGEGPIYAISWQGSLIAWANEIGVKIFDVDTNQRITFIGREPGSPRPDQFKCNLCWVDEKTLVIGWADTAKIAVIKERNERTGDLPSRFVEIVAIFQTDFMISGIAPFGEYFVLLAYVEEEDAKKNKIRMPPELRIFTRAGEEISGDVLEIRGYQNLPATSYQLAHIPSESIFYIVSPKDIVMAKPRDLDDHISWLIDPSRARYKEAMEAAEVNESQLRRHKLIEIGEKYLLYLLDHNQPKEAAALCPKILKRDAALWEKWIAQFAKRGQLDAIGTYIPVGNPVLKDLIYEMVLAHYLKHDHKMFLTLINEWPHTLYNIHNIITAVLERVKSTSDGSLMDALATLYTYDKQFDKTLHICLRLKRETAFDLIAKHNLFHAIQDKVILLMECHQDKAIALFVANTDKIPIKQVVEQLYDHPRLQHAYLHALFVKNPHAGSDFHLLAIRLYAEYDYKELMPFLVQTIYPLEKAYKIVEEKKLYPEMVYILGRMGNTKDALDLIIEKIGDVKMAINFIQEQHDEEDLWESLIEHSMKNPVFVSGLLENIGASEYVKPLDLIKRIPEGMKIIGLRDRLVKIISDYNLQMALREGCNSILKADCVNLITKLHGGQQRGMLISQEANCPLCSAPVLAAAKQAEEIVPFFCSHVYHSRCLKMAVHTMNGETGQPAALPEELKYSTLKSNQQEMISLKGQSLACVICNQNKAKQMRKQQPIRKGE